MEKRRSEHVTSFNVATAANYTDSERLQGDTASNSDAAPQHEIQFIDYIGYCQQFDASKRAFMLRHNNIYRIKPISFLGGVKPGGFIAFWLGVSPCGRAYFLLLRQKKVAKEKATPGYAVGVANFPALLEIGGGCGTRATPSNSPRPLSAAFSVARRSTRGPKGGMAEPISARMDCYGQPGKNPKNPSQSWPRTPLGPLGGAEQRRNAGGLRFAMFEPQASSGKPPGVSSSARNRRSRHRPRGRLFFAYFLLAKQKKVR
ncbi:MAG: hypothetical protein RLZZ298_2530, partial [Pseudomonadota bacterium]